MVTKTGRRPIIAVITMVLIALVMFITTNGCKKKSHDKAAAVVGSSAATADTTRPTVMSTIPADIAVGVPLNRKLTAVFSEAMDPATISTTTFTLTKGITNITGTVTYAALGYTATFSPTNAFTISSSYTAKLTIGVKDLAGNALAVAKTWNFTTGSAPDTTPPTVTYTNPANLAIDVPINVRIEATFTEAMDPTTISTTTFTVVGPGDTSVTGTVALATLTATFLPDDDLASSTLYTATITTGVKDLASNALAVAKIWTFTTGAVAGPNLAPVLLGTAGNFVVLAKSAISAGAATVGGDVGLSPAAASFITEFGLIMDSGNTFSTSTLVTPPGKVYAADYAPPTPINMGVSIGDMEAAYTDAAGRTLPDFTELYAGDISGQTLVPGLYKWGTSLLINGVNTVISGTATDVWIFQIAGDLTVGNGAIITLGGNAQASNIFWQVAGQTTLGTTVQFKGTILCQTLIAMQSGTVVGRALAQTAVTIGATTITAP